MQELQKPIGRAWRHMRLQRFLTTLIWSWGAALALVALGLAADRLLTWSLPGPIWLPFAMAGGIGLVVALGIALLSGPSRIDAAVALDHAFHLNERLSTALTLPDDLRQTPAGRALVADALRHASDLDIASQFRLRLPRRAWVPLIPAALAAGLLLVPDLARTTRANPVAKPLDQKRVAAVTKALSRKIGERRKEMDKSDASETEKVLAQIEEAADRLAKAPPAEKDKALVQLNTLTDALKERQKALGSPDQVQDQLQQLERMAESGPAEEFARNLMKGNFGKAADELAKLREKLAAGQMNEQEKQQLMNQLDRMKQQLDKLANQEQLRKQLEKSGLSKQEIEKQLAKQSSQTKQDLQKLQQLAQQLGQTQQALKQGNMADAAKALGMSQQDLERMAEQVQEMETLDAALADLQDAKQGMTVEGMNQLGSRLGEMEGFSPGMGDGQNPGNGLGRGRGQGRRPLAPDRTNAYDTNVKGQLNRGKVIPLGFAPPGTQTKGESVLEIQESLEPSGSGTAGALSNQKVPSAVKKHIVNYFDEIRQGK